MISISALGRIGPILKDGGQGTVYELLDRPGYLLKRYHKRVTVDLAGLVSLVEWRASLSARDHAMLDRATAWPLDVVDCEDGRYGILMRRAVDEFWQNVMQDRIPRVLSWAYMADSARFVGLQPASPAATVTLLQQLVTVFDLLHRNQAYYGDLSDGNVLWSGGNRPTVFVIDCDSAAVDGYPRALQVAQTPLWKCPWAGVAARELDEYKLALAFLRLYFRYQGPIDHTTRKIQLPAQPPVIREAVDLLVAGLREVSTRPTAADWLEVLRTLERGLRVRKVA